MALTLRGSATCSVLDFLRTELQTMLAIAFSDRIARAMQCLASHSQPHHHHEASRECRARSPARSSSLTRLRELKSR